MGITSGDIERETKAIDKLCNGDHPNIIRILAHGDLRPPHVYYYIDMEYCDIDLDQYLRNAKTGIGGLLEWPLALEQGSGIFLIGVIMQQIVSGLHFIHSNNQVHRDLTPQNGIRLS